MSFIETLFSFWKKASDDTATSERPKIFDQVEVAFWQSNTYRAENADLDEITSSSLRVTSYWDLKRGTQIEFNITFPAEFPCQPHSIRVHAVVTQCRKPKGRRRYRIDCRLKDIDASIAQKIQEFKDWAVKQAGIP